MEQARSAARQTGTRSVGGAPTPSVRTTSGGSGSSARGQAGASRTEQLRARSKLCPKPSNRGRPHVTRRARAHAPHLERDHHRHRLNAVIPSVNIIAQEEKIGRRRLGCEKRGEDRLGGKGTKGVSCRPHVCTTSRSKRCRPRKARSRARARGSTQLAHAPGEEGKGGKGEETRGAGVSSHWSSSLASTYLSCDLE